MLKKIITWAIFVVFAVYAFTNPHGVATFIHGLLSVIPAMGTDLANFVNSL